MRMLKRIYYRLIMIEALHIGNPLLVRWARFKLYKNRK